MPWLLTPAVVESRGHVPSSPLSRENIIDKPILSVAPSLGHKGSIVADISSQGDTS